MEHLMESFDSIEWEQSVSGRRKQASFIKVLLIHKILTIKIMQ